MLKRSVGPSLLNAKEKMGAADNIIYNWKNCIAAVISGYLLVNRELAAKQRSLHCPLS